MGNKVLFVARDNGCGAAIAGIRKALDGKDVAYEFRRFDSVPCIENAEEIVQYVTENHFDIVCGVGGGVMGDIVKLVADLADIALVQIPTSSATCVAATPLSIMYDRDTLAYKGGYICRREADAVIADTTILIRHYRFKSETDRDPALFFERKVCSGRSGDGFGRFKGSLSFLRTEYGCDDGSDHREENHKGI